MIMDLFSILQRLGIALGLGLLIGLQRERAESRVAGFRTFPLITMLGTILALLAEAYGGWIVAAGVLGLGGLIVVGNFAQFRSGEVDPGLTTEVTMLLMFAVGAYLVVGPAAVAVTVTGCVAVLLHLKPEMHSLAAKIGEQDFRSIMTFVLITLVILPVLPDHAYGPYHALNPFKIWLLVVLTVGISLGGYVVYKILGAKTGAVLGGILGGLISSTATTVSYARRSRGTPETSGLAALVIMIAAAIVFVRVLIITALVAPGSLAQAAPPLGLMLGALSLISLALWRMTRSDAARMPEQKNPTELRAAILFAAIFALVLFAVGAAKKHYGERGLYVVAILSGLTEMDAISLSTGQMMADGQVSADTGWRLMLAAALANVVFKGGAVAVLGDRKLFVRVAVLFGISLVIGVLLLLLWPKPGAL
jgi:uncharacterized membrane protein (DUF4010 family)